MTLDAGTGRSSTRLSPDQARDRARSDARLLELFGALALGETEALDELYDRCGDSIFGLALWRTGSHEDAADLLQDTFVRLAASGGRLASVRQPRTYLLRITHRLAIDLRRRRQRRRQLEGELSLHSHLLEAPADANPEVALAARNLGQALTKLPPKQREAIYLHHFSGLTYAEIGKVVGVPTFTAASRVRLGLKRLQKTMGVRS